MTGHICPNCELMIPVNGMYSNRLDAQDYIEVDVYTCPGCDHRFAYVVTSPWNIEYEDEKGKLRSQLTLGWNHVDAFRRLAVRRLGWSLVSGSRSSTYD